MKAGVLDSVLRVGVFGTVDGARRSARIGLRLPSVRVASFVGAAAVTAALGLAAPAQAASPLRLASAQQGPGAMACAHDRSLASRYAREASDEDAWAAFDREQAQLDEESGKPAKEARAADLDALAQKDDVVAEHDASMAQRYRHMVRNRGAGNGGAGTGG